MVQPPLTTPSGTDTSFSDGSHRENDFKTPVAAAGPLRPIPKRAHSVRINPEEEAAAATSS